MDGYPVDDEKRFAVVMYGGVSLAVYIHGVAQELHRLVRSTLPGSAAPTSGSEKVYRWIGKRLRTRFVVDILSGTSAGGINAIFLAKALATGSPLEQLEKLWLDEGDIAVLINDRRLSGDELREGFGLKEGFAPPRSLLKSRRMYRKLLAALEGMDRPPPQAVGAAPRPEPMVPEIDLFVTATDLQGLPVPLKLSDKVVYEYRHRSVFHFRKTAAEGAGDFGPAFNPFLAFAARATSSFPFAFEPMRLVDTGASGLRPEWEKFCREYLGGDRPQDGESRDRFTRRAFADGGYLDNKPFSYAIEAIARSTGDLPVDRKLIYIEPSPERVRDEAAILQPPNAVENVVKVFSLARYETIREDLQEILERNRLIERVDRILQGTLDDILENSAKRDPDSVTDWLNSNLSDMIGREGIAYGGYMRLRVAELTDDLAAIIVRQAGFETDSDLFLAVREIIRAWRDARYDYYVPLRGPEGPVSGKENFSLFLKRYNIRYYIARLRFTIRSLDRLARRAGEAGVDLGKLARERADWSQPAILVERLKEAGRGAALREQLRIVRAELRCSLEAVEALKRRLFEPDPQNPLTQAVAALGLSGEEVVREILDKSAVSEAGGAAAAFLGRHAESFGRIEALVREIVHRADLHSDLCKIRLKLGAPESPPESGGVSAAPGARIEAALALPLDRPAPEIPLKRIALREKAPADAEGAARWMAAFFFRRFPHYDIVAYPILRAHGIGEELDPVEVIRISPEDATQLSDRGGRKLGGTEVMHFGAFFDRTWRKNDILWGRLDGAERLITCLVAGTPLEEERARLVRKAHREILAEFFQGALKPAPNASGGPAEREVLDLLIALALGPDPASRQGARQRLGRAMPQQEIRELLEAVIQGALTVRDVERRLRGYQVDRRLEPRELMRSISRATQVIGRMLDQIAAELAAPEKGRRAAAWITRAGSLLWGLIEVATPESLGRLFFRHWVALALLVGGLMTFFGPLLAGGSEIRPFGIKIIALAVLAAGVRHLFQAVLERRLRHLKWVGRALTALFALAFTAVAAVGVMTIDTALGGLWSRLVEAFGVCWEWLRGRLV